jgi:tetratricopeptide (TPR) repeat protein
MRAQRRGLDLTPYLRKEPVILTVLIGIAVIFFLVVSALARVHEAQRLGLAEQLAAHGATDLEAAQFRPAVENFRIALQYSPDNSAYQLSLAQALIGLNRYDEAQSYLANLRDREPDNGLASLELARVAVKQHQTEQALRFYHNAIYSTWLGSQDETRPKVRLELIHYLIDVHAMQQADAELINLDAEVAGDPGFQVQIGTMFANVGDHQRALAAYEKALALNPQNANALSGAGAAAFASGQYANAEKYLREAIAARPEDAETADLLKKTETVLHWDPFRQQIPGTERNRIALEIFKTAGKRFEKCTSLTTQQQMLQQNWTKLKPRVTEHALTEDPGLVNAAVNLAFAIEQQTASSCGQSTDADQALLLIARLRGEG